VPRDQVFISYSHRDTRWRDDLDKHLKPYLRGVPVKSWSDQQIAPGSKWFAEIESALENAKVAVLLISPDFLASDFIHEHELGPLLKKADEHGVTILWVPVRDSAYKQTPLTNYQAVIDPMKPLARMNTPKRDQAWVKICDEIKKAVNDRDGSQQPPPVQTSAAATEPLPIDPIIVPVPDTFSSGQRSLGHLVAQSRFSKEEAERFWANRPYPASEHIPIIEQSQDVLRDNLERLWSKIQVAASGAKRLDKEAFLSLCARWRLAEIEFTPVVVDLDRFRESKWEVLDGFYMWVLQSKPIYAWSGNLWLLRLPEDENFRWCEVSYFEIAHRTQDTPFGLRAITDRNADRSASSVVGPWQLAFGPIAVDGDGEASFHRRWMELFAKAAIGALRPPQSLPLSTEPAPAAIFTPFSAISLDRDLFAERESLFDLGARDRREAIKKSWELLAKDILWAGNIEIGQSDPDSPAVSIALQRLQSTSTTPSISQSLRYSKTSRRLQERYSINPNGRMILRNQTPKNSSIGVKQQGGDSVSPGPIPDYPNTFPPCT
jgi:hypothetical protein